MSTKTWNVHNLQTATSPYGKLSHKRSKICKDVLHFWQHSVHHGVGLPCEDTPINGVTSIPLTKQPNSSELGAANFFYKGPHRKYVRLGKLHPLSSCILFWEFCCCFTTLSSSWALPKQTKQNPGWEGEAWETTALKTKCANPDPCSPTAWLLATLSLIIAVVIENKWDQWAQCQGRSKH